MKIHLYNSQRDLKISKRSILEGVGSLLEYLKVSCEEISFYFVTEKKICALHKEFFQDPTPTDCITFPIDNLFLGEVFICPKVALEYAKKRKIDPGEELFLYIVHGVLHLLGHDDLEPKAKQAMRKKEKSCMRHLRGFLNMNPVALS